MKTLVILLLSLAFVSSVTYYPGSESFNGRYQGITKKFTCKTVKVVYSGTTLSKGSTKVSCTARWPTAKALSLYKSFSYILGKPETGIFRGTVTIKLVKKKKKAFNKMTTTVTSVSSKMEKGDPKFSPISLWCPQNNYFIWGEGDYISVLATVASSDYKQCAELCASNSTCFSWTRNGNSQDQMGLSPGQCRLYGYMKVSGISVPGVQSGYHKCWNAMLTSVGPDAEPENEEWEIEEDGEIESEPINPEEDGQIESEPEIH